MIFTRYIDTTMFTNYDVTRVFERNLAINRLGKFAATRDGFLVEEMRVENEGQNVFSYMMNMFSNGASIDDTEDRVLTPK